MEDAVAQKISRLAGTRSGARSLALAVCMTDDEIVARAICKLRGFHEGPLCDPNAVWPCKECGESAIIRDKRGKYKEKPGGHAVEAFRWRWPA